MSERSWLNSPADITYTAAGTGAMAAVAWEARWARGALALMVGALITIGPAAMALRRRRA